MAASGQALAPSTFVIPDLTWDETRRRIAADASAGAVLADECAAILRRPLQSVTDKPVPAPSGSRHDYLSVAPYWWPDPDAPDGLPWVRRDGEVNAVFGDYDNTRLDAMCHAVASMIVSHHTTGDDAHGRFAGRYLSRWFLDAQTRMNPNLDYAQGIPGVTNGRGIGIIDTAGLIYLLDAVPRLSHSPDWTVEDLEALRQWFSDFVDWLLTSDNGLQERAEANNHGTWYDAQVVAFAIFAGRPEVAERQLERFTLGRLAAQIAPDGSMPHELSRTLSQTYSSYNLLGFLCLASLARQVGIDLWGHEGALPRAVDFLVPYVIGEREWTHPQIAPFGRYVVPHLLTLTSSRRAGASAYAEAPQDVLIFSRSRIAGRDHGPGVEPLSRT